MHHCIISSTRKLGEGIQRFSGCLTKIHFKFWCMHTHVRACSMRLHYLNVGVLFVSTHTIDQINTQFSGLDFRFVKLISICHTYMYMHVPILEWILVKQPVK